MRTQGVAFLGQSLARPKCRPGATDVASRTRGLAHASLGGELGSKGLLRPCRPACHSPAVGLAAPPVSHLAAQAPRGTLWCRAQEPAAPRPSWALERPGSRLPSLLPRWGNVMLLWEPRGKAREKRGYFSLSLPPAPTPIAAASQPFFVMLGTLILGTGAPSFCPSSPG